MSNKDLESLIDEALNNIRNDRKVAREFLKHIETLQRSNEQLVKLIGLRQKDKDNSSLLSDDDKHNLFDLIQGDSNAS